MSPPIIVDIKRNSIASYLIVLNFRDFRNFAQIRENKFPQIFSEQVVRENKFPRNFFKTFREIMF